MFNSSDICLFLLDNIGFVHNYRLCVNPKGFVSVRPYKRSRHTHFFCSRKRTSWWSSSLQTVSVLIQSVMITKCGENLILKTTWSWKFSYFVSIMMYTAACTVCVAVLGRGTASLEAPGHAAPESSWLCDVSQHGVTMTQRGHARRLWLGDKPGNSSLSNSNYWHSSMQWWNYTRPMRTLHTTAFF